ncbi:glycosyl transferase family 1 [Caldimicrobium thiodismutans]|uniref:Glycosyl transferase family 1 n=1 Tax=Caldimicrobium thiodismutans TaxID=1653476 RepID=A0A0U4W399_9BACT|nr:glycosyltransferase [Caldimicrobium thiodismutans]BAU23563.1 glycosyl transferase family 1 [Caldimicrobium thiodismutans]
MSSYLLLNSLSGGGAERVTVNLFKALNFKKFFLLEKEVKYEIPEEKIEYLSNHTTKTSSIHKTLFIPVYALRLSKKLKAQDIVLSMLERANYVNIVASFLSKHKSIISIRMSQRYGRPSWHPYNFFNKLLYPKADLIITVSKSIKAELEKFYGLPGEKIKVIYNPVYFNEIQEKKEALLNEYEPIFNNPVLITAGRLTKQKGQWYLIRIFKALKKDFPNLKLVILGEGELKGYLVKLSQNLGLKTFVWDEGRLSEDFDLYLLGFQKNPFKFIARSELFVFPSLWEGFPNALVEAMACGVPVISSDCRSGPREILAPETDFEQQTKEPEFASYGVLMPPFEVKYKEANEPLEERELMWVEVIKRFLKDEELRRGYAQRAVERAKEFDIERIVEEWRKII